MTIDCQGGLPKMFSPNRTRKVQIATLALIALTEVSAVAHADNIVVVVQKPDYVQQAIVQLEVAQAIAQTHPTIDYIWIWTACGHYTKSIIHYTNGTSTTIDGHNEPINQAKLNQLLAGGLTVVIDENFDDPQLTARNCKP
jgi:hypothetical protein